MDTICQLLNVFFTLFWSNIVQKVSTACYMGVYGAMRPEKLQR